MRVEEKKLEETIDLITSKSIELGELKFKEAEEDLEEKLSKFGVELVSFKKRRNLFIKLVN